MSFRGEMLGFARGLKAGTDFWGDTARRKYTEASADAIKTPTDDDLGEDDPLSGGGGTIPLSQGGSDPGKTSSTKASGMRGDELAWKGAKPYQRALLNTIAGPESGGRYNVIYGGGEFGSYADHPRHGVRIQTGPNAGRTSSAAGKYQFLGDTWDRVAKTHGLQDFSPENQDKGAWFLAVDDYKHNTGRDLDADLQSGDPKLIAGVGSALKGTWTSLPGGIEQGTTTDKFVSTFNKNLSSAPAATGRDVDTALDEQGIPADSPARDAFKGLQEEEGGGEEQQSAEASYSPDTGIPMPETIKSADIDPFAYAQLLDQEIPAGPQTQPSEKGQSTPALFAAEGGAIPEPQYMAVGGTPNAIDYTQAPPPTAPVKPVTVAPLTPAGPTASQLAFRKLNQPKPVVPPPVAPKPATPAAPTQSWIQMGPGGYDGGGNGTGGNASSMVWRMDPISGKRRAMPKGAHFVNQKLMTALPNLVMPGLMRYEEGGMIPEPGEPPVQQFPRGGSVEEDDGYWTTGNPRGASSDDRFQQLLKEEQRRSQNRGGGDNARDRAARRLSAEEGRPSSTAYRPGRKQLAPGKGGKIKTKQGDGEEITTKSIDKPLEEDRTTRERPPGANGALLEDRATRERRPANAPRPDNVGAGPTVPLPPLEDAGVGVLQGKPKVDIGTAGGVTRPPAESPFGDLKTKAEESSRRHREELRRKFPNNPIPRPDGPGVLPELTPPEQLTAVPPDLVAPPAPAAPPPEVPVLPEPIDLRPAPTPPANPSPPFTPPPAPAAEAGPTPVDHARLLQGAMEALAKGADPKRIGDLLLNGGIPQELWPLELQNSYLGFAEGGMIPEPGQRGYNEAVAEGRTATREAQPEPEQRRATPKLLGHVSQAVDGGIRFLTREFGLDRDGAVPSPDDEGTSSAGAQRLASGEGAATPEEIQEVDNAIDPDRRMHEGDRHMTRMAKTVQWYLERGRKDDAEAAAASLMQYGAKRFGRLGMSAEGAYREYLDSGDPKDLKNTTDFLEAAYKMIPDGADINISIDPETNRLQGTRTTADGKTENYDLSADEIPGLLKSTQDGSMYWNQIYKLGDPEGTKLREQHAYKQAETADTRRYDEQKDLRKRELDLGEKTAEEERAAGREEGRSKRDKAEADRVRLQSEAFLRSRPDKGKASGIDAAAVAPALAEASTAKAALDADPDNEELQSAYNVAASRLYDATGLNAQWMTNGGYGPDTFEYQGNSGTAGAASEPPVPGAQRMLDENNQEIWAVEDPDSASGWSKVE